MSTVERLSEDEISPNSSERNWVQSIKLSKLITLNIDTDCRKIEGEEKEKDESYRSDGEDGVVLSLNKIEVFRIKFF